jgi:hypothetical protein
MLQVHIPERPAFRRRSHPFISVHSDERREALACDEAGEKGDWCAYCGQGRSYRFHIGREINPTVTPWWMLAAIYPLKSEWRSQGFIAPRDRRLPVTGQLAGWCKCGEWFASEREAREHKCRETHK